MRLFIDSIIPILLSTITIYGIRKKVDVYDALIHGAGDGLGILLRIVPSLIALLTAVSMLRASGVLELVAGWLEPILCWVGIPPETVPLLLVRPISGSAALGVGAELISAYGADSAVGRTAAVMLGATETTFYTIAVYFGAVGIKKTRYAIPAALCADLAAFLGAVFAVQLLF